MISVDSVSFSFLDGGSAHSVLKDLSLNIPKGEIVSVVGPSGCGKSTLLRLMAGILKPLSGHISIEGYVPQVLHELRKISMVFQEPYLLEWKTVGENIILPKTLGKVQNDSEDLVNLKRLLSLSGLTQWKDAYPHQLSVGMKQRVALVRGLITDPSLIIMDEPFSALDDLTRYSICHQVHSLLRTQKRTVIMVTHNIEEACFFSDRVITLSGNPAEIGKTFEMDRSRIRNEQLWTDPDFLNEVAVCKRYLLSLKRNNNE